MAGTRKKNGQDGQQHHEIRNVEENVGREPPGLRPSSSGGYIEKKFDPEKIADAYGADCTIQNASLSMLTAERQPGERRRRTAAATRCSKKKTRFCR
jgi:hypothetical protein